MADSGDPSLLDELQAVIGREATRALLLWRGGTKIYVPREVDADHAIAKAIGLESAERLVRHFAPEAILLPKPFRRRQQAIELLKRREAGEQISTNEIALRTDYSTRQIENIDRDRRGRKQQLDLFG